MSEKFDKPILVVVDHTGNEEQGYTLTAASEKLLKVAATLTSDSVFALALTPSPQMDALGRCGVSKVLVPDLAGRSPRVSAVVADAVKAAARVLGEPLATVMCVSNYRGREVASILGAHFKSGAAVDVTEVSIESGELLAKKNVLGGQWDTTFSIPSGLPIVAMRPGAGHANEVIEVPTPGIIPFVVNFASSTDAVELISSTEQPNEGPSLGEAEVVVCVGYGTDGDLDLPKELASRLNGALGATRVVCDEGWLDRSRQIGQTGVSVAPKLYIGVGVSGAVHHTCGIQAAQKIVAVVDDSEAPLVQMSDFAVIGDFQDILEQALQELPTE
ncbi:electron transfer flavoprotein subunit alpha/FixB family protein [Actinomycetaceae bacterium TAE3-ERU4]|nr:electron transfer flavoprotein subunit alpha/FixB family protein [Actinomycetaceae bacterium TAE3-ERU4]